MAANTTVKLGNITGTVIRSGWGFAKVAWDNGSTTTVEIALLTV